MPGQPNTGHFTTGGQLKCFLCFYYHVNFLIVLLLIIQFSTGYLINLWIIFSITDCNLYLGQRKLRECALTTKMITLQPCDSEGREDKSRTPVVIKSIGESVHLGRNIVTGIVDKKVSRNHGNQSVLSVVYVLNAILYI